MFSLFTPDEIIIDPYEFFKIRGGGFFHTFCSPCGVLTESWAYRKYFQRHIGNFNSGNPLMRKKLCIEAIGETYAALKYVLLRPKSFR